MRLLGNLGLRKKTRLTVIWTLIVLAVMFLGLLVSRGVLSYGGLLLGSRAGQQYFGSPEATWATYVEIYNTNGGLTDTQQIAQRLQRPFTIPAAYSAADWVEIRRQEGAITSYSLMPGQVLVLFRSGKARCFFVNFVERDGLYLISRLEPCE